nr:YceI family protein [Leptospira gomenensis]
MSFVAGSVVFLFCLPLFASEFLKKEIRFEVDHPMKLVQGTCREVDAEVPKLSIRNTEYKLDAPFRIRIPILKIKSGDENRDSHMAEILGYPDFQEVSATIESVSFVGGSYSVKGKLTIREETRSFQSEAKVESPEKGQVRVFGKLQVRFSEFKLERPSVLFTKTKDEVEIDYDFLIKI